jgi:hypothetical protein
MKMLIVVFYVVTPCSFVDDYQHFRGTCEFHLKAEVSQDRDVRYLYRWRMASRIGKEVKRGKVMRGGDPY